MPIAALIFGYQLGDGREKVRGGRNLRLTHTSLSSTQANHVMLYPTGRNLNFGKTLEVVETSYLGISPAYAQSQPLSPNLSQPLPTFFQHPNSDIKGCMHSAYASNQQSICCRSVHIKTNYANPQNVPDYN